MANKLQLIREMIKFIQENNIKYTCELIDYAMENRFNDWFKLLVGNNDVLEMIDTYIQAMRHKALKEQQETKY